MNKLKHFLAEHKYSTSILTFEAVDKKCSVAVLTGLVNNTEEWEINEVEA